MDYCSGPLTALVKKTIIMYKKRSNSNPKQIYDFFKEKTKILRDAVYPDLAFNNRQMH